MRNRLCRTVDPNDPKTAAGKVNSIATLAAAEVQGSGPAGQPHFVKKVYE